MSARSSRSSPHRGTVISVGYEGRDLDRFLDTLHEHRVEVLVDVRLTSISRKPGFSKRALAEALPTRGIEYRHVHALGNPKANRTAFRPGSVATGRSRHFAHLNNGSRSAFEAVIELARAMRIALLCVERDERPCHRGCITDQAQEEHPALTVVRL